MKSILAAEVSHSGLTGSFMFPPVMWRRLADLDVRVEVLEVLELVVRGRS